MIQGTKTTYVYRSPRSAERALISLNRRSRRSPLDEDWLEEPAPPPPMGARSNSSNRSRCVGVSGSVQLDVLAECRLAEVISRLVAGGGVDGISSTTTISGTSKNNDFVGRSACCMGMLPL